MLGETFSEAWVVQKSGIEGRNAHHNAGLRQKINDHIQDQTWVKIGFCSQLVEQYWWRQTARECEKLVRHAAKRPRL